MKECYICGRPNSEEHHRIFRSECKPIEKCKMNHVYLCADDHRGTYGVHGRLGKELNRKLKLEFQEWLQSNFLDGELYKPDEIKQKLDISISSTEKLLKTVQHHCYLYRGEDIVRACLGGKLIE